MKPMRWRAERNLQSKVPNSGTSEEIFGNGHAPTENALKLPAGRR